MGQTTSACEVSSDSKKAEQLRMIKEFEEQKRKEREKKKWGYYY